jgi:hypothetical protein
MGNGDPVLTTTRPSGLSRVLQAPILIRGHAWREPGARFSETRVFRAGTSETLGPVTVHGAARAVFSAACEGDSPIFAAATVDHWAKTPFVPRKLGQSPCERLPMAWTVTCRLARTFPMTPQSLVPLRLRALSSLPGYSEHREGAGFGLLLRLRPCNACTQSRGQERGGQGERSKIQGGSVVTHGSTPWVTVHE